VAIHCARECSGSVTRNISGLTPSRASSLPPGFAFVWDAGRNTNPLWEPSLLANAVGQSPGLSQDRRLREQARSHPVLHLSGMLEGTQIHCGSRACSRIRWVSHQGYLRTDAFASKLAPTRFCICLGCWKEHKPIVGAELTRECSGSVTRVISGPTPSRASSLPPGFAFVWDAGRNTNPLWEPSLLARVESPTHPHPQVAAYAIQLLTVQVGVVIGAHVQAHFAGHLGHQP